MTVHVQLEFTPNPDTLKYTVSRPLLERGAASFDDAAEAAPLSPLAARLLGIQGVTAVMIGRDFVTLTVSDPTVMGDVHAVVLRDLPAWLDGGTEVVTSVWADRDHAGDYDDVAQQVIEILDAQIRPAVARDGGDIVFDRFDEGVVYLRMKGSCAGCPSSLATLKQGIEARLRQTIPEVLEVRAV
ncbi:MAG: NifU family protein [Planctomycetes bacterium]|nr:NifU family protein [Planctomycetota bacterium]MCB9830336.1 NifU family protein [Planctomycetota bacterium]MCB9900636.1 NifU family protein [Planctomycetota bacterium]